MNFNLNFQILNGKFNGKLKCFLLKKVENIFHFGTALLFFAVTSVDFSFLLGYIRTVMFEENSDSTSVVPVGSSEVINRGETSPENLQVDKDRMVVYGSFGTRAHDFTAALNNYLEGKGMANRPAKYLTDPDLIEDAFYFATDKERDAGETPKTKPKGVVIFPQMRSHTPTGMGYTVDVEKEMLGARKTIAEHIADLCDANGVPYLKLRIDDGVNQLTEGLDRLFQPPQQQSEGE